MFSRNESTLNIWHHTSDIGSFLRQLVEEKVPSKGATDREGRWGTIKPIKESNSGVNTA